MSRPLNLSTFIPAKHGTSHWRPLRLAITLVALGALAYGIGHAAGLKWSACENFFKGKIATWKMVTIISSICITAVAVAIIFHRAIYGEDSATKKLQKIHGEAPQSRGSFWGDRHWAPIFIHGQGAVSYNILDISTLDEKGDGYCFAYEDKFWGLSELISLEAGAIGAPLYPVAITAYQTVGWALAARKNNSNVFKEIGKSAWKIVRSPFYALAYFIAQLWVFIDPPNGRKIVANIERDWNGGTLVNNGCALAWGSRKYANDQGMDLGRDDHTGFYIQGCFQPTAILKFEKNQCVGVKAPNGYVPQVGAWQAEPRWQDNAV